ncbi:MAG: RidA family protein [Nitriliruptorales bacterium]|nr:RidA family protein [Nitriliruptorales bacterium]
MPDPPHDRRLATGTSPYEETYGFSRAVRVGNLVSVAGTAPVWPDGAVDPDPAVQARRCWSIVGQALVDVGSSLDDVVRTRMYITDPDIADAIGAVHSEVFGHTRPAATMVVVAGLLDPRWYVEVEADAVA